MNTSAHLRIFVLIDALGWRYLEGRDFLSDLLPHRQPLKTVLGYSSGAIPTILTGLMPVQHGKWNLLYYDPAGSPFRWLRFFSFLPRRVLDHRITSKLMQEMGRKVLGLGPLFQCAVSPRFLPWFNWAEKRNLYAPGGVTGAKTIFDWAAAGGIAARVYSYHRWTDSQILDRARDDVLDARASFFFLYLSEMDAFLHYHCQDARRVDERLDWYATRIRRLFEAARSRDSALVFAVVSDHGMTPVQGHYDLVADVVRLGLRMPEDYLAVYDSTMARFWFFNDRTRDKLVEHLAAVPCGRILSDAELAELGILFPDRRYGQVIFLLHPGLLLTQSNFNGGYNPTGMHGYHPDDPHSDAAFLSNRAPGSAMRSIADVFRCMEQACNA